MTILRRVHAQLSGDGRCEQQILVTVNTTTGYIEVATREQSWHTWGMPLAQIDAQDDPPALVLSAARSRVDL